MASTKAIKIQKKIVTIFFVVVFAAVLLMFGQIVLPFITPVIFAALLSLAFLPMYKKIKKRIKNAGVAAAITCSIIVLIILIPLGALIGIVSYQAFDFYNQAKESIDSGSFQELLSQNVGVYQYLEETLERYNININLEEQRDNILNATKNIGLYIYEKAGGIVSNLLQGAFYGITIIFAMYYFFKDHKAISKTLLDLSPLPDKIELQLVRRMTEVGKAVFFGNMVTAGVQGIAGGLGFLFFGLGNSVFWGVMIAIASLIPSLGVFIIAIPASVVFFAQGEWVIGIGFLVYNLLLVGSIDNVLKPKLIESKIKLHPLLVFIAVLGGLIVFGPIGIIYGPLVVTLTVSFIDIYREHFREGAFS